MIPLVVDALHSCGVPDWCFSGAEVWAVTDHRERSKATCEHCNVTRNTVKFVYEPELRTVMYVHVTIISPQVDAAPGDVFKRDGNLNVMVCFNPDESDTPSSMETLDRVFCSEFEAQEECNRLNECSR